MIFKVKGQIFWQGDTPRFALPLFIYHKNKFASEMKGRIEINHLDQ